MGIDFEELDYRVTQLGELSLRRRRDPVLGMDIFEVKLNEEFLMSSGFALAESELATMVLSLLNGPDIDVLVGGLGLGYTAFAALKDPRVRSLTVVDTLAEVIGWHDRGLVPLGPSLRNDPRCRLVHGDFFAMVRDDIIGRRFDAILLDIDHSPRHLLHPDHSSFYSPESLRQLAQCLRAGGAFGMWSNNAPDAEFMVTLSSAFAKAESRVVTFPNPYQQCAASATIYLARRS